MIKIMKNESGRRIMKELLMFREKIHGYLVDDGCVDKKTKAQR